MEYGIIGLIILILDIIAIISILGANKSVGWKVVWTLVVLLLPVIGMIIYFLVGKST
ncbi:MAG: PLDc N-terminal domain-containing protein [Phycisphaerales bacterium]